MPRWKILIASDHGGVSLKTSLIQHLSKQSVVYEDLGCHGNESVDYPAYALEVGRRVRSEEGTLGVLLCGTGIGMSVAANKIIGIRAALCSEPFSARMARAHNDANVLCMGARVIGASLAEAIIDAFLSTPFEGGRHQHRLDAIRDYEVQEVTGRGLP